MDIELMRAEYNKLVAKMGELANTEQMTDAQRAEFDRCEDEAKVLERSIRDTERREQAVLRMMQSGQTSTESDGQFGQFNINRGADPFNGEIRSDASVADLQARVAAGLEKDRRVPAEVSEGIHRTILAVEGDKRYAATRCLATGSDAYRSAFVKYISGRENTWTEAERQAIQRAQSLTNSEGGYAVPFTLDPTLIGTNAGSINPLRQIARQVTTTTNQWAGVTGGAVPWSVDGEAEQVSDDSITLAQPNIPVYKMAGFVPFSIEIEGDWAALEQDLRMAMQEGRDNLEAQLHLTGSGSSQHTGIVTALTGTASEVAPTVAETFAAADLYKLQRLVPPRHRLAGPTWVLNIGTIGTIRQFDTSGGGNFLTSLGNGTPESLLGWRMVEHSLVDEAANINPAAAGNNRIAIVGNWSRFVIVDRVGMNVEMIPHLFGTQNNRPTGQRGMYAWQRGGSACVDINAFRMLNVTTS